MSLGCVFNYRENDQSTREKRRYGGRMCEIDLFSFQARLLCCTQMDIVSRQCFGFALAAESDHAWINTVKKTTKILTGKSRKHGNASLL